jgi:hypothetical protein
VQLKYIWSYIIKPLIPLITVFVSAIGVITYFENVYHMSPPNWLNPLLLSIICIYVFIVLIYYGYQQIIKNVKIFKYNYRNGTMWNKDVRNIAFRVETINRILASMYEHSNNYKRQIQKLLDHFDKARKKSTQEGISAIRDELQAISESMGINILEEVGYKAGKGFAGDVLLPDFARPRFRKEKLTQTEKVQIWCKYDSDVGWGRFSSNLTDDIEKGEILVEECFLNYTHGKDVCPGTCSWMVGYIRGVLDEIKGETSKKKYKVTIDDKYCDRSEYCHFVVSRETLSTNQIK